MGISTDSVARLKRFAEECGISFPMASDANGEVTRLYDVRRRFGLGTSRVTYVIDEQGVIRDAFHNEISMTSHALRALQVVQSLEPPDAAPRSDNSTP